MLKKLPDLNLLTTVCLCMVALFCWTTGLSQDERGTDFHRRGTEYLQAGEYDKARPLIVKALRIFREDGDALHVSKCYQNLGVLYHYQSRYEKALPYYLKAAEWAEKAGDHGMEAGAYSNIGGMFSTLKQYDKSLEYQDKAIAIYTSLKDTLHLAYGFIGKAHTLFMTGQYDEARQYNVQALAYGVQTADPQVQAVASMNIADYYKTVEQQYDSCLVYAESAVALAREAGIPHYEGSALNALAFAHYYKKNYSLAEQYARETIELVRESGNMPKLVESYGLLSDIYSATGRYPESLEAYKQRTQYNDSLVNEKSVEQANTLEARFQSERKDKQLTENQLQLERKNKQIYLTLGGILVLICLLVLLYRNYRQKQRLQKQKLLNMEKENEVKNLLAIMQGEERERARIAGELHDGIGGTLAAVKLNFSAWEHEYKLGADSGSFRQGLDLLEEAASEIRKTAHNLMPEILRKEGLTESVRKFCRSIHGDAELNIHFEVCGNIPPLPDDFALSVYRMIQELVQNVIRHARASEAIVQLSVLENTETPGSTLTVTVEDNGCGFDASTVIRSDSSARTVKGSGMGLNNMQARVKALNGNLEIESSPATGTTVSIEFDLSSHLSDASH